MSLPIIASLATFALFATYRLGRAADRTVIEACRRNECLACSGASVTSEITGLCPACDLDWKLT